MDRLEEAAKLIRDGAEIRTLAGRPPGTRGRQSIKFQVGEILLSREEVARAKDLAATMTVDLLPRVMTPEDFVTFARSATPMLVHRAVQLAMQSDDARVVLSVAKEIAERGYGRVAQSVEVSLGPDVRGAWKQLQDYGNPIVDAEFLGEEDEVKEEDA